MIKLLIIYPHWYPSNLAGVHRPRLTGNFMAELGWKPIIITVNPEYYEELTDLDMYKLFSPEFTEYRVAARKIRKPRLIGDIGLRALWPMYLKAKEVIASEKADFLWIPIPSFYTSLLGRMLHLKTGIPYGIDYIDPWVRDVSKDGSLRARLSLWAAKVLEPIAVKKASLITGVAEEYYRPVLERNFLNAETQRRRGSQELQQEVINKYKVHHVAFPYGFDPRDHEIEIPGLSLPWDDRPGCRPIVYAGAFMPNSQVFMEVFFKAFAQLEKSGEVTENVHLYFLGTGLYPHKRITDYAADHGLSHRVTEIRDRFPFLHILNFLAKADRLLIIGSTEKHYTASKTFQVIMSKRPFLGMFHKESTAVDILKETRSDDYLVKYDPESEYQLEVDTLENLKGFLSDDDSKWHPEYAALEPYSAKRSAEVLIGAIEKVLEERKKG